MRFLFMKKLKKEIKEIEKKYKDEETAVKKQAEIIRNDFFKAVFE